jgi:phenylacetate-CoA ligase
MNRALRSLRFAASAALGRTPARTAIEKIQAAKLHALLVHACTSVPFYRRWLAEQGLTETDLAAPEIFHSFPVLTKAELRRAGADLLSDRYPADRRTSELTTGSSGQPFATHFDSEYVLSRNFRFLRALFACGYRPGRKLMLITERPTTKLSIIRRWLYSPLESLPEEHARQLGEFCPDVLYGCMTPLRLLAQHLEASGRTIRPPRCVISTAEMLDSATRELLERVFRAPVADFYGMTEMGLVAWQLRRDTPYVLAEDGVLIERLPLETEPERSRLVMTNLDLWAMPMIRYDTGDMGGFGVVPTGREGLLRIEGRSVDCILDGNGRVISPFQLTSAMQYVPGLQRFRIRQTLTDEIEVDLQTELHSAAPAAEATIARLTPILGAAFRIRPRIVTDLPTGPGSKFRVVESLLRR